MISYSTRGRTESTRGSRSIGMVNRRTLGLRVLFAATMAVALVLAYWRHANVQSRALLSQGVVVAYRCQLEASDQSRHELHEMALREVRQRPLAVMDFAMGRVCDREIVLATVTGTELSQE